MSGANGIVRLFRLFRERGSDLRAAEAINPALKSWIDNVIVPILVREYFAAARLENTVAPESKSGIESAVADRTVSEDYE